MQQPGCGRGGPALCTWPGCPWHILEGTAGSCGHRPAQAPLPPGRPAALASLLQASLVPQLAPCLGGLGGRAWCSQPGPRVPVVSWTPVGQGLAGGRGGAGILLF